MTIRIPYEMSLNEGELPIWFDQMSWAANWTWLIFAVLFLLLGILSFFWVILSIILLIVAYLNVTTSEYFISNKRIFVKYGFISRVMNDIKMEWVTNTSLVQDWDGRILGFGNVLIATPGTATGTEMMIGVSNPMRVKSLIEGRLVKFKKNEEISQSLKRLHEEYKMGRLDEARYHSLKQEYESEMLKNN